MKKLIVISLLAVSALASPVTFYWRPGGDVRDQITTYIVYQWVNGAWANIGNAGNHLQLDLDVPFTHYIEYFTVIAFSRTGYSRTAAVLTVTNGIPFSPP